MITSFVLPSCPPQPVLWVSSSRAQRDSAQAVQDSATLPSGGHLCVRVALDTYVQNLTLPTPRALVSIHKCVLIVFKNRGAKQHKHLLASSRFLPYPALLLLSRSAFVFTISDAVSLFLWGHLARLL